MKKLFLLSLFCSVIQIALADELLYVTPQSVVPSSTSDDGRCFCIEMQNDGVYRGVEFDLYLPEGVDLDDSAFDLNTDRFPSKRGKPLHTVSYGHPEGENYYHVLIFSTDDSKPAIKGNEGAICDVYYITESNLKDELLKVEIRNVNFAISATESAFPKNTVSFFYKKELDFSTLKSVDFTGTDGVTPKDVATEARELMTNPNSLLYLNEGSNAEGLQNVVVGETCESLVLTDGYEFNAPKPFTATTASYSRTLGKDGWYSLCLPFAATAPANVTVERFTNLDVAENTVYFDSGSLEADKPCIFNAKAGTVEFTATAVAVAATPDILADRSFIGTYRQLPMGTITGYYALFADGSGFGIATDKAYVTPFRGILDAASTAQSLKAVHGGITTEINTMEINSSSPTDSRVYNLNGQHISIPQQHGIYIINNKKVIK